MRIQVHLKTVPAAGGRFVVRITQGYGDGQRSLWVTDPAGTPGNEPLYAPVLTVVPADGGLPTGVWAGLAVVVVALAGGGLWLIRRRRTGVEAAREPDPVPSGFGPDPVETAPVDAAPAVTADPDEADPVVAASVRAVPVAAVGRPAAPEPAAAGEAPLLAVDYGTSNTVAMLRWPDGRVRPLLFDSSPLLPSAVQDLGDQLATGRDAVNAGRLDPSRHEQNPKRRIDEGTVLLGDREHEVADLIAATLRRVVDEMRRVSGSAAPAGTVLTHPAAWGAIRRSVLLDAAERAGLPGAVLVPEPVAAATYFVTVLGHGLAEGQSVLVYDLGAGTFDATVVRRSSTGLDILAADGLDDLGGLDLDALVVDLVGATFEDREEWRRLRDPRDTADRRFARLLWDDARAAKESLSRQSSVGLSLPSLGADTHVTREQFEVAAQPLIIRTVRAAAAVLRAAQVPPDGTAGIFLVGGSTRVPLVATLLLRDTGLRPIVLEQPETVVAEGALHLARAAESPRADA
ncbi:Hsp70 family protein [Dactylosporangium sp. NPDC049742]|uniref:Hsp70 family protein n=1 Tax=Dactylosporangium sp. NPDC049742 TaxID=3154737 RepID=UPI0034432581